MAKKNFVLVRLVSTAETGYFKVKKRNVRATYKLDCNGFDPVVRKHVRFVEKKMR